MMRSFFRPQLVFIFFWCRFACAVSPLSASPSPFVAFSKIGLEGCASAWSESKRESLYQFLENNEGAEAGVLAYIVIPKWTIDSSERKADGLATWGVFDSTESGRQFPPAGGAVRPVTIPEDLLAGMRDSYVSDDLRDVYGRDIIVLDDVALKQLFRLRCLNRDSPFSSSKLDNLKRFTDEFLVDDYAWLMNPKGKGRMIFISDFRSAEETRVQVVIPREGSSVLSIPVFRTNRAVLRDAIQLLKEELLPITLSFDISSVGFSSTFVDFPGMVDLINVQLLGADGDFLAGFNEVRLKDHKLSFLGYFSRETLDATRVRVGLPFAAPYRFVRQGELTTRVEIPLPEEFEDNSLPLKLSIAYVPQTGRLLTEDIWHHEILFGDLWFARNPHEIDGALELMIAEGRVAPSILFTEIFDDPQGFVRELGSRIGNRIMGLNAKQQRGFADQLDEVNRSLKGLWSYIQVAQSLASGQHAGDKLEILIIKHVPAPVTNWRWVVSSDRMSAYVQLFLEHMNNGNDSNGIVIKEVEAPAHEDHITHSLGIILAPVRQQR